MKKVYFTFILLVICAISQSFSQGYLQPAPKQNPPNLHPGRPASAREALLESNAVPLVPTYWMQDSTWYFTWTANTSSWFLNEKNFLYYNNTGALWDNLYTILNTVSSQWDNLTQYVYTYGPSGNTLTSRAQTWYVAGGHWVDFMYYHYDDFGRVDTTFYKTFDQGSGSFLGGSQSLCTYNVSNQILETLMQSLDTASANWVNSSRVTYAYLPTGQMTQQMTENWNASLSSWVNSQKYEYTYDVSGFLTEYLTSNWNVATSQWIQSMRATYTNSGMGLPTLILYEQWNPGLGIWENTKQETRQYNASSQVLEVLDQQWNSVPSTWVNSFKQENTYYPTGYQETMYQYYWNPGTSAWMDSYYSLNDTLGYNSEYYSKSIDWSNYTYIYGYRYLYFYNPSHQPSQYQHFDLDTATSAWILSAHRLFTYDGNGNNIEELDQSYNGSIYENEFKMDHFYSFTTGIGTKPGPGSMCYYANPLPKGQPIQCKNLQSAKDYRFTLYSISGQLVFTTNIHDGEPLILPQTLSEGVYLMQVYGNEKMVAQGKIILIN